MGQIYACLQAQFLAQPVPALFYAGEGDVEHTGDLFRAQSQEQEGGQAFVILSKSGIRLPELKKEGFVLNSEEDFEQLTALDQFIFGFLNQGAKNFVVEKEVFNTNGLKVKGKVFHLGHVAAYYQKDDSFVPLVSGAVKGAVPFALILSIPNASTSITSSSLVVTVTVIVFATSLVFNSILPAILRNRLKAQRKLFE